MFKKNHTLALERVTINDKAIKHNEPAIKLICVHP